MERVEEREIRSEVRSGFARGRIASVLFSSPRIPCRVWELRPRLTLSTLFYFTVKRVEQRGKRKGSAKNGAHSQPAFCFLPFSRPPPRLAMGAEERESDRRPLLRGYRESAETLAKDRTRQVTPFLSLRSSPFLPSPSLAPAVFCSRQPHSLYHRRASRRRLRWSSCPSSAWRLRWPRAAGCSTTRSPSASLP